MEGPATRRDICAAGLSKVRRAAQAARRLVDEVRLLADPRLGRASGSRVVFLPSTGREGAAFPRIWAQAEALKASGWQTVVVPPWLKLPARHRVLARLSPDIVVMQGARHPLNRPALYPGHRVLYDMDDADFHLDHLAAPVAEAMGQVAGVIAGSRYVANWTRDHGARQVHVIQTGAPVSDRARPPQSVRPPVIAWAQSRPENYPAEARFVARVMAEVARTRPDVRLRLFDRRGSSDPAVIRLFEDRGLAVEWVENTLYRDYLKQLEDVALGLAPISGDDPFGRGKSFGKILAYLDRHVPVIASDANDHRLFLRQDFGVITNDPSVWASQILRLLDDAPARQRMAEAGFAAFRARLSSDAAASRLADILDKQRSGPAIGDAILRQEPGQGACLVVPD